MEKYDPQKIEEKWQKYWKKHPELYTADEQSGKEKKYILDMFPYPSGDGLHVGHVESYTATDIVARYLRMKGYNVLHPQGFDAFGLPAENYAIKTGVHPAETTKKAIVNFKGQMEKMGFSYDWSREVNSSDPEYYRWTQWLFLLLYKNGLAYKKKASVNWCPKCQTVLANEQAEGGVCERCGTEVVQKDLEQWFFKITDFVEDRDGTSGLISGLDKVDWPESTKSAQKNWIGKSEGAQFEMKIAGTDEKIEVYTTRVDTVFGMTYAVVAPEHPIIQKLKDKIENYREVEKYLISSQNKTELERTALEKEKTGVELKGIKVINPFNGEDLPLFVADYVLGHYGTGAVMAVPAHDERDFAFAKKYNLPINAVVQKAKLKNELSEAFTEDGILVNSGKYNGLTSEEAREKLTKWLEGKGIGKKKINYKLRDWLVSRQRYWGAPIPIIYCPKCVDTSRGLTSQGEVKPLLTVIGGVAHAIISVPEKDLPVMLPTDVDFKPTGESPLKYSKEFQDVKCPICGAPAKRESDTMDTFVCSSWYYLRYADPKNNEKPFDKLRVKKWLPVDLYVGGAEHTVLHLLYSRFFTKVLHKLGYIEFDEPFLKMRHQGLIISEDGRKMSKSLGNVVNPDQVVDEVGADALRMFEMFMGPLEDMKPWNTKGIVGITRFIERVWKLQHKVYAEVDKDGSQIFNDQFSIFNKKSNSLIHKTIKKVTEDIEAMRFNTAIAALMILINDLEKQERTRTADYEKFILLLSSFAPHIAEELWSQLGHSESIFKEKWPEYDPKLIQDEMINLVIQVNGKVRDTIEIAADINEEDAKKAAMQSEKVKKYINGKEVKKVIYVKGRLVNMVV